jgi:transcription-repair coupling factor (superfamily II helicase)
MKDLPFKIEVTRYPQGFKLEKKGLKPDEYAKVILEVLHCFA